MTLTVYIIFLFFRLFKSAIVCDNNKDAMLTLLKSTDLKCLDGSPPGYYIRKGIGNGVDKWNIHFEGGGWSLSLDNAIERSKSSLGSSLTYEECETLQSMRFYKSGDASQNPLMHNWNIVHVRYCDASSYAGDTVIIHKGHTLYFNGKKIRDGIIRDLLKKGMSRAEDVVISGCSAGGLGVFLGLDQLRDIIHQTNKSIAVVGLSDSGVFADYKSPVAPDMTHFSKDEYAVVNGVIDFPESMRRIFNKYNMAAGTNPSCLRQFSQRSVGDPRSCVLATNLLPHISTPIFVMQPRYDQWGIWHIVGANNVAVINEIGRNITEALVTRLQGTHPYHGVFIDSCAHHCTGCSNPQENSWNGQHIVSTKESVTPATAFERWFLDIKHNYYKLKRSRVLLAESNTSRIKSNRKFTENLSEAVDSKSTENRRKANAPLNSKGTKKSNHFYIQEGTYPCDRCCLCRA